MRAPKATVVRLGLYFAAVYAGGGVGTPFIGLWLRSHGMDGAAIGIILAAPMLARIVTGPGCAVWADGFRLRRTAIGLTALISAIGYAGLLLKTGFWVWLVAWSLGVSGYWVSSSLADVLTLRRAERDGFGYARARVWGSLAYIVANVGAGLLLARLGVGLVPIWLIAVASLATLFAFTLLPDDPVHDGEAPPSSHDRLRDAFALMRDPVFMLMVISAALVQSGHAFYYGFSTLVWRAQGIAPGWSGILWGVGVAAEVVFLWFGEPLRRRLGPERLLVLGALGATIRWTALAFRPPLWLLFPLQLLHTLSFTATFVASLELADRLAPRAAASAAQSLNAALSFGLVTGLATIASGPLYDHVGAWGYMAMALLCAAGLAGAIRLRCDLTPRVPDRKVRSSSP